MLFRAYALFALAGPVGEGRGHHVANIRCSGSRASCGRRSGAGHDTRAGRLLEAKACLRVGRRARLGAHQLYLADGVHLAHYAHNEFCEHAVAGIAHGLPTARTAGLCRGCDRRPPSAQTRAYRGRPLHRCGERARGACVDGRLLAGVDGNRCPVLQGHRKRVPHPCLPGTDPACGSA